jgi:hypothetical protein
MKILENGIERDATPQEVADFNARQAAYVPSTPAPTPTKEQLMAQLAALSAQIQALE